MNDNGPKSREESEATRAELRSLKEELTRDNAQLREQLERVEKTDSELSNLFVRATIAILFLDEHLCIRGCTPTAMRLLGLSHDELGRPFGEVASGPLQDGLHTDADTVLNELKALSEEILLENGRVWRREISPNWTNVRKVEGVVVSFIDVTDLKKADDAKRRLAAIVESSDDAIISKSLNGTIQSWNRAAERLFGYTADEIIGQPITRLEPKHRKNEMVGLLERLKAGERIDHFETERVAKDGRIIDISLTVSPIFDEDNQVIGASKVARDISANKAAEAALRASEQHFRALVETQAEMLCRFRIDGTILFVNEAYARTQDKSAEELVGTNFWTYLPADERSRIRKIVYGITPDSPEVRVENQLRTNAGTRWTLWTNRGIEFDTKGRVLEAQSTGIDITERKLMEEKLRISDVRKDQFLATLGHELRNPLAPLRAGIDLLQQASSEPEADEVHRMMQRQIRHLMRLVDDLVDISRITRGDIELRRSRVDCNKIIDAALELSGPVLSDHEHALVLKRRVKPIWIDGDFERLTQVVSNLLNNAAKYSSAGGTITISTGIVAGAASIKVADTGLGFSPNVAESLFDMFARLPQHQKCTGGGGLGVGLSLARQLVELHEGSIKASSRGPGKGSIFEVRVPLAAQQDRLPEGAPGRDGRSATEPAEELAGRRVLVVDDNVDAAQAISILLSNHKHIVDTVHDGNAAIKAVRRFQPEVVLLDIGLPGADGYEVAQAIRQMPIGRYVKLIALTGWGQEHDKRLAKEAGFDEHLTKPADIQRVLELIGSVAKRAVRA